MPFCSAETFQSNKKKAQFLPDSCAFPSLQINLRGWRLHNDLFIIVHFMMWTIVPVFLWHVMFTIPFMPSEIPSPVFVSERLLFMSVYISPAIILVSMLYSFPTQRPFRSPAVIRPASMDIRWFLRPHGIGGRNTFYPLRSFSLIISVCPVDFSFLKSGFAFSSFFSVSAIWRWTAGI